MKALCCCLQESDRAVATSPDKSEDTGLTFQPAEPILSPGHLKHDPGHEMRIGRRRDLDLDTEMDLDIVVKAPEANKAEVGVKEQKTKQAMDLDFDISGEIDEGGRKRAIDVCTPCCRHY
jgi:hypothetical protein